MTLITKLYTQLLAPYQVLIEYPSFTTSPVVAEYVKGFVKHANTLLPKSYIDRCIKIMIVDPDLQNTNNYVHGGVCIQPTPELFRTMAILVKHAGDCAIPIFKNLGPSTVEMNGLWLHNSFTRLHRVGIWLAIFEHISKGTGNIVVSYDVSNRGLDSFYTRFFKHTLYKGLVPCIEGMDESQEHAERVCWATINELEDALVPYAVDLLRR
jgi:hypothetical protein